MTSLVVSIALAGACTGGAVALADDEVVLRTWPVAAEVDPGQGIAFAAWFVHTSGDSVPAGVDWTASAGTIDASGRFTAPGDPGAVLVVARDAAGSGRADTSRVTVRPPDPRVPVSIQLTPASVSLHVGASSHLSARVANALGALLDGVPVQWTSSAPGVVRVDAAGGLLAVAEGSARIVATVPGEALADTAEVDVARAPVASVRVSPESTTAAVGAAVDFSAGAFGPLGEPLAGRSSAWSSSAPAVASVDGSGRATALAAGTAVVSAVVEGVEGTAVFTVTDTATVVGAVRVTPDTLDLSIGESRTLTAAVVDGSGVALPNMAVAWSSSAPGVATVGGDGRVRAMAAGAAAIRATAGGVTGAAAVRVAAPPPPPPPPPAVASVDVSPAAASVSVGGAVAFAAVPRAADGSALTGRAVAWSVADAGVVSVAADGAVTGVAPGTTTVRATSEGVVGTATVTVSDPGPPAVASVDVSPAALSLTTGASAGLAATPRDAGGAPLAGRTVTWSTADGGVATVDGGGTVSAVAAGATTITATVEGIVGTATVSVTAPGGAGLADECGSPGPGWVWCDDFDQDRLGSYFEFDAAGGSFQRTAGVGVEGSSAMRAQFAPGQVGAGALHLALGRTPQAYMRPADAGTADYRELYWRMYVRYDPGWIGGGGEKLSRAFIFASPSTWAQAMIAHVWSGGANEAHLVIDPARGTDEAGNLVTTQYNDFANMTWLGAQPSATPLFDAAHVGRWYCIEAHVRLNTAGQSDGVFQLWIDDGLEARRTGLNWLGAFADYGLNAVYVENFWNDGAPRAQGRTIDNFVVSTQRIGC